MREWRIGVIYNTVAAVRKPAPGKDETDAYSQRPIRKRRMNRQYPLEHSRLFAECFKGIVEISFLGLYEDAGIPHHTNRKITGSYRPSFEW